MGIMDGKREKIQGVKAEFGRRKGMLGMKAGSGRRKGMQDVIIGPGTISGWKGRTMGGIVRMRSYLSGRKGLMP